MKWILVLIGTLASQIILAESSKVLPVFVEAAQTYQMEQINYFTLKPEIRSVIEVFTQHQIDPSLLENFQTLTNDWKLPEDDKYDLWIKNPEKKLKYTQEIPAVSLQALKIDVVKSSQMSDDVYAYFFVTDGVMPTGKVTSIYKGVSSGESFFFNPIDRAIFPLIGVPAKTPSNHLIIDYGIIESDGDDIAKLQKLSSIIIDLAIAVYTTQDPANGAKVANLRKEIKLLAEYILSQNNDDRLITDSFGFQTEEIAGLLSNKTYHEFKKNYKYESTFYWWEYNVHFRLLK
jgi:hypothetical protein